MKFTRSNEWYSQATALIPIGSQTYSKCGMYFPRGASPLFIHRGKGSHVWDLDGNEFVDWICALGPITLGYQYPAVDKVVKKQLKQGAIFSLPSPLEFELAREISKITPVTGGPGMVRFLKTGTEACMAAVRAARAYTKKDLILSYSYHGWSDGFIVGTERSMGIPEEYAGHICRFDYNNIPQLETLLRQNDGNVAAIIMEPVVVERPESGYLHKVRQLATQHKAVLIFDEIVTGMRWGLAGAGGYFGVVPDMVLLGKGMANGFPLSAICGDIAIMYSFEDIMVSSTFGGDCIALAAGMATLKEMQEKKTIKRVWDLGRRIMRGLEANGVSVAGYPCRPKIVLKDESPECRTLFLERMIEAGHLMVTPFVLNISYSHSEKDVDSLVEAAGYANRELNEAIKAGKVKESLTGEVIQTAFRRV